DEEAMAYRTVPARFDPCRWALHVDPQRCRALYGQRPWVRTRGRWGYAVAVEGSAGSVGRDGGLLRLHTLGPAGQSEQGYHAGDEVQHGDERGARGVATLMREHGDDVERQVEIGRASCRGRE